jgi:hypothetical protein
MGEAVPAGEGERFFYPFEDGLKVVHGSGTIVEDFEGFVEGK